ncbi:MAG TPA: MarR family winged helix-turn-helix transcriptional regulator [Acidimicrobiales bacterium]|jgi:DNA-binding MarR family transcriptional regulator|nr:MarR family winged helix-turn-helix transcriptional regulator [Acidimicrobiales bacterium]
MANDRCEPRDLVTFAGLVFETAAGLRRAIVPPLERDYDFPQQSLEVLIRLSRSPGGRLRMSDLAAQTALTPSGLTRAVDRLCDAGLVVRQVCSEDRRGAFAALTDDGTARMEQAMYCHLRQIHEVLGGVLDDGEMAALEGLLRRIRDHLNPNAAKVSE